MRHVPILCDDLESVDRIPVPDDLFEQFRTVLLHPERRERKEIGARSALLLLPLRKGRGEGPTMEARRILLLLRSSRRRSWVSRMKKRTPWRGKGGGAEVVGGEGGARSGDATRAEISQSFFS